MKLSIVFLLIFLTACGNPKVKEEPQDIASINDELLLGDENFSDDKVINGMEEETRNIENEIAEMNEIAPSDKKEALEQVTSDYTSQASRPYSNLDVIDSETGEIINANECLHIVKNQQYKEPTCLKRR